MNNALAICNFLGQRQHRFLIVVIVNFCSGFQLTWASLKWFYAMAQRPSSVRPSTFHILNFFSRTAEGIYSQLATNVPFEVPTKCCYFFKSIRNPIWPHWPLIGWHILNFFSRTAERIYSNLATNVPYEVLTNCCYFLSRFEIQYDRPGLWLANTFWTSQERLKGSTPNLPQMFLMRS